MKNTLSNYFVNLLNLRKIVNVGMINRYCTLNNYFRTKDDHNNILLRSTLINFLSKYRYLPTEIISCWRLGLKRSYRKFSRTKMELLRSLKTFMDAIFSIANWESRWGKSVENFRSLLIVVIPNEFKYMWRRWKTNFNCFPRSWFQGRRWRFQNCLPWHPGDSDLIIKKGGRINLWVCFLCAIFCLDRRSCSFVHQLKPTGSQTMPLLSDSSRESFSSLTQVPTPDSVVCTRKPWCARIWPII